MEFRKESQHHVQIVVDSIVCTPKILFRIHGCSCELTKNEFELYPGAHNIIAKTKPSSAYAANHATSSKLLAHTY